MSDVPVQVIVAAFKDVDGAGKALSELKEAAKKGLIKIDDAAVLVKDAQGKLNIKDVGEMSTGKGAVVGAVVGGVLAVIFPPSLLVGAVAGGAIGGLAAKLHDGGFPEARLKQLGEGLTPNSSAIVAVVEHEWVAQVQAQLAKDSANMVTEALAADMHKQLTEGKDVGYTAVATDDAVAVARVTGTEAEAKPADAAAPASTPADAPAPPPAPQPPEKK